MSKKVHNGIPAEPGYYWAKWKIAEDGTDDTEERTPSDTWEIVEVVDVGGFDETKLLVNVFGVSKIQSPENFYWGDGPLKPPE